MRRIGELIAARHEFLMLSTGAHGFYARLGWMAWRGATWVDECGVRARTPDDDDSATPDATVHRTRVD